MAGGPEVAVLALAPAGRRRAAAGWWFVPALLGGGFWYLRNLIVAGNPLPQVGASRADLAAASGNGFRPLGPIFSIAHYATDTGVWRDYFAPGSAHSLRGALAARPRRGVLAGSLAVLRGRDRVVRWMGAVALFGMLAYLFTPLSAAGAEGARSAFAINVRYLVRRLSWGSPCCRCHAPFDDRASPVAAARRACSSFSSLTDRSDAVLRDPARLFRPARRGARRAGSRGPALLRRRARGRRRGPRRGLPRWRWRHRRDRLPGSAPLPAGSLP